MTPQEPKGEQASADAGMQVAMRMIEHTLAAYLQSEHGSRSDKAKACMRSLEVLTKAFGKDEDQAQSIMPAELKSALLAPAGGDAGPATGGGAPPMQQAA